MKKILFILPSLAVGGLERVQVTLANALVNHGYDVVVMVFENRLDLKDELDERVRLIYKPYKPHKIMKCIPYIRNRFYDDGMWETRTSAKTLYKYYVGAEKYDVEIAFFRGTSIKIVSGSTNKNATHIGWVHTDFSKIKGYINSFKNFAEVKKAYSSFDSVVCVSNEAKEGFIKTIGDTGNLKTVYNMVTDEINLKASETPQIKTKKRKLNLVIVARLLDNVKGQKRLINSAIALHNEGYDLSLTIVGGGPDEQMLKDEIASKNAEDYIIMTGSQLNPYPYIKNADVLICSSYFEGFNLTVAEALILGTPVISTNCTGPNEILDHGKYGLIVENSEEGLYNGIKKVLDNPDLLSQYRKKAKERKEFFNENKIIKQITDLF